MVRKRKEYDLRGLLDSTEDEETGVVDEVVDLADGLDLLVDAFFWFVEVQLYDLASCRLDLLHCVCGLGLVVPTVLL